MENVSTPTKMSSNYNPHNNSHFLMLQDYFPVVANWLKLRSYICTPGCSKSYFGETFSLMYSVFRDTAGQERFKTITTAYYRGAMVSLSTLSPSDHK